MTPGTAKSSVEADGEPIAILRGRYALLEKIGRGGQAQMFLARDEETGRRVAVKKLGVEHIDNWKALELFEREGETLANLDHPAIPQYVDAFSDADQEHESVEFYLVQEFVEGTDYAKLVESGTRFTEDEIVELLREVLGVLVYLQELNPPIVHRDLKPSNLMRCTDGSIAIVDFGAIQATLPHTMAGGSTIVGTSGYMPPEQSMGRAVPATDLYALGATAVHLLGGVHPAELEVERLRLQYDEVVDVSPELQEFLDRLLEPSVEDRPASASEALDLLDGEEAALVETGSTALAHRGDHIRTMTKKYTPRALIVGIGAQGSLAVLASRGIGVVGQIAGIASSFVALGVGGYLGMRILQDHPALAAPSQIEIGRLVRPVAWLTVPLGLVTAIDMLARFGLETFETFEFALFTGQAVFWTVVLVVLGFVAGGAYRVVSASESNRE